MFNQPYVIEEQHAMRAFVVTKYKEPLREADVPEPTVGERDVLVQVQAAGLNQLDEKIRLGEFKQILPYKLPLILGNDVAGTVIRVGAKVRGFKPGDEVYARPDKDRIGTFAERIAVAEADLALKPASISMEEAGSLPLVALTAWQALVEQGNVQPGQKVLIHAGAGGVGSIAIQLAKHLGATVATTASAANADFVRDLGADIVIDYRTQDFEQLLTGYDLVLDSLGGENLEKSLRILKPGGKAIGIAGPPDPAFARKAGLNPVLRLAIAGLSSKIRRQAKKLGVSYEFLFMRASGDQLRQITALVDDGVLRPVVGQVFDFDQTPQALAVAGQGRHPRQSRRHPPRLSRRQPFTSQTTQEDNHHEQHRHPERLRHHLVREGRHPHHHRRRRHLRLPRAGAQGRHPRRLLRAPRRDPGQLGPAHHRPHREEPPRHHLRPARRRRLHRAGSRQHRGDGRRRLHLHQGPRVRHRSTSSPSQWAA